MTKKRVCTVGLAILMAMLVMGGAVAQNTVPNVLGMTQSQATSAITGAGLALLTPVSYGKSANYPAGQVFRQDPAAGVSVAPGTKVKIVVSQGIPRPEPVFPWGTNPATSANVNSFCDAQQAILDNSLLSLLPPEFTGFLTLLGPDTGDINGTTYVIIANPYPDGELEFSIGGNGWIDCKFDLKLIEIVLKNQSFNIPAQGSYAGLTHAMVYRALNVNAEQFEQDIGSYWSLLGTLANGLPQVLLGHMIVGNGQATFSQPVPEDIPFNRIDSVGSGGFMQALMMLLGSTGYIANPLIDVNNYIRMPEYFAQDSDADGDGASNRCEYNYVAENFPSDMVNKFVEWALDPTKVPECPQSGLKWVTVPGDRWIMVGDTLTLSVLVAGEVGPVTYGWTKDGTPLASTGNTYTKENVSLDDAGTYTCTASDPSKASISTSVVVRVFPAGSLPVGAPIALGALAGMLAGLGGVVAFRKRG